MAQTNFTPIQLYYSTTGAAAPTAGNLVNGELAINITDGRLFYKDNLGVVQVLATKGGVVGPASSTDNALVRFDTTTGKLVQNSAAILDDSGNLTGLAAVTMSGALTLSGGTANGVAYLNGSKVLTTGSALTFDGTNLTLSDTAAIVKLRVNTQNSGVSASNYSQVELADNGTVRSYWRNVRDGTGATQFAYNSFLSFLSDANGTPTEQMRLTSTGLGIGTSSPATKLDVDGPIRAKGYTVAALPTGVVGARAYVTNALAPVALATVVGGGSAVVPVFFNGTNWIVA